MALDTVLDYVTMARRILQDTVEPYRFPDVAYLEALNASFLEMRRLRADMFIDQFTESLPDFQAINTEDVPLDVQYRMAAVYYMCGHVQLYDDESVQDSRATAFFQKFTSQLLTPT